MQECNFIINIDGLNSSLPAKHNVQNMQKYVIFAYKGHYRFSRVENKFTWGTYSTEIH